MNKAPMSPFYSKKDVRDCEGKVKEGTQMHSGVKKRINTARQKL